MWFYCHLGDISWDKVYSFSSCVLIWRPLRFLVGFVGFLFTFESLSLTTDNSLDFPNRSIYAVTMFRLAIKLLSLPVSSVSFLLIWGHCHLQGRLKTCLCDCSLCGRGLYWLPLAWQHFSSSILLSEMSSIHTWEISRVTFTRFPLRLWTRLCQLLLSLCFL